VRSKIAINNNIIEHIITFISLGCSVSYQKEKDITVKTQKFLQIMGIQRTSKPSEII